uniref:EIPR1-like beta-propeller domain-containing protein n=1 Tax=Araucaria cunninghamii TaxID=56994 RepID=A0A0D6R6Q8_ARACU
MQALSGGVAYGLKYQARCIANVIGDSQSQQTSFLVGTLSLREENEVHLIQLSPFGSELTCEGLYSHPHEIWDLASCPFDLRIFSTVYASGGDYGAALWRIPEPSTHHNAPQLEQLGCLDAHTHKIKCVLWWPSGRHGQLVSIDEETFYLWSLDSSTMSAKVLSQESAGMLNHMSGGAWDPHDINTLSIACESSVQFWDLRSIKQVNSIGHAQVRDLDYNPSKQHIVVTAGDDSRIRIWDLRMPNLPSEELTGHTHWTWCVQYNPIYDELILSAGTDSTVNLWQTSPIQGRGSRPGRESPTGPVDPLVRSYSDFEDSVYGLAWSRQEPCIFASLSYDGRVVVNSVPQNIQKEMNKVPKM